MLRRAASSRSTCSGSGCSPRSRRRVDQIARLHGEAIDLSRVPLDDPAVYAEIQAADTVGVFQIESRAQMQSLLRTRPENLDDLTVQVALVRPGPIQGKAVHPYIENRRSACARTRRSSRRSSTSRCASRSRDTLGVVVFQDQVLDGRDGVGRVQRGGGRGAAARDEPQAQRGGDRGVPAALRRGLPRQRDRRADGARDLRQARRLLGLRLPEVARGGVRAARLPVGVAAAPLPGRVPVRAPERAADGLLPAGVARARRAAARGRGAPAAREPERRRAARSRTARCGSGSATSARSARTRRRRSSRGSRTRTLGDLARRAPVGLDALEALVASGACDDWGPRRELLWQLGATPRGESAGGGARQLALPLEPTAETPELPAQTDWERMLADYRHTSLSVGVHPLELLRPHLAGRRLERRARRACRTARGSRSRAWPSRASGRRPRRASSSCCSRTSTARST